ncbi:hypothetical protein DTO013E5_5128 [Penicillium roqueforti]|uniref:Uncharacterized protein n=1 Tax=Penicillium roqueforti (strain FM164) TaxID=1365484 RepID=W6QIX8_PENRF|nr:uncharacterized protein LCP9604111_5623 [Penicillium roqueforti]CDM29547.1 hypothetical protein PROQFM164_S01g003359 [Penicillium roqueforti FM164]KAF9248368.1 hypothetical protein LCP9604111_5623 [Penicillium roqueforti]KAI1836226.1 hypothetical protein CBS147337_3375 [Penicillium roqueforti]KAI2679981.1 hypothetical protein LCP963914a_7071 [Penicillium roqueforti]KAI2683249.1 hypothetical protein CBS147355_2389 [Penicillium roqueforti]
MARKLALLVILMHAIQILALPTPYENSIAFKSVLSGITQNNRHYFPETIPDQDELIVMLKETAMREAGFVLSSNPDPQSKEHKTETELHKSLPNPYAAIGTDATAKPQPNSYPKPRQSKSKSESRVKESFVVALGSYNYPIYWPPFGFFVIAAAVVCFCTILRGIRAKK